MNYYYIYSAGGGAGDWNGVKRIWKDKMPIVLKNRVLLKFGDLYFNHASIKSLIKKSIWRDVINMRSWLSSNVMDNSVLSETSLLLDSGTSKIVNYIAHNKTSDPGKIINEFDNLLDNEKILEKYAKVIIESKVDIAVSFDIPNPFKIRTQSEKTETGFFNSTHQDLLIERNAIYANKLFSLLGNDQTHIATTINGSWSPQQIQKFLSSLKYIPKKIAVGGLTREGESIRRTVDLLNKSIPFKSLEFIHFLGCGGIKNSNFIKSIYNGNNISVDNSTPMNRSIDGNTMGTTQSGYFDYFEKKLHRIKPDTINQILDIHKKYPTPIFSVNEMEIIFNKVLLHQSGRSSKETYDSRAQLSFHNHDVFRVNAI